MVSSPLGDESSIACAACLHVSLKQFLLCVLAPHKICPMWQCLNHGCSTQAHWSATVHLALLAITSSFVLSLLPFAYFALHQYWHWYQSGKAPTGAAAAKESAASFNHSSAAHQDGQSLTVILCQSWLACNCAAHDIARPEPNWTVVLCHRSSKTACSCACVGTCRSKVGPD